ncbi:PilX [Desulforapulum autotrophicum HRM2]|uniref:PilX n=1 Tax=Desulforapulum autotrophicum (strain ATCC 43914 / DSM 3382 / VKM B-1955 / HRM2) TaxID=177437 RepID=C0QJ43_DESAH|nr:pilus assembly PilX N-terminal domain-containing protein [Desulforapulum autotrophicum]ACN15856.1 PilX [Desulforapulum autotrophicum HRM2]
MDFVNNDSGSALIMALLILTVLTIIGISAVTTSTIETKIASNDMLHKKAFYSADGGTEVGREVLEQNVACPAGFKTEPLTIGTAVIENKSFALEENEPGSEYPTDTVRDVHFPADDTQPHTNIIAFGNTQLSKGSALQMAAGYEGKGKGAAGGGGEIIYSLYAKFQGKRNSRSCIMIHYRHLIGHEGECNY